jgi:hypothetical protein
MATITSTSSTPPSSFDELVNKYMVQLGGNVPATNISQAQMAQAAQQQGMPGGNLLQMIAAKKAASKMFGGATSEAANAAINADAGLASQAAWNAGADSATASSELGSLISGETAPIMSEAPITGGFSSLGIGPQAGIIGAGLLGGRSALRMLQGKQKNWKDASLADNAGRLVLGMATFGGSELANKLFGGHKSTRDVARGNTSRLLKVSPEDTKWQDYVKGMRGQYDAAPSDPSKPFAGKYANWNEYKKAGLEAGDLTGVLGNLELGPDYGKASFDQQKAITQKLIDKDQYYSKKGEVKIKDQALAKQIASEILGAKKK